MSDSYRIIYIAGAAHSGSTLLDLLIGSHSEVQSLGELKALSLRKQTKRARVLSDRCTCGAPFKLACDFWQRVDQQLHGLVGCGLAELDLDSADSSIFIRHNAGLFRAIAEVGGTHWIVDSSKSPRRLARLKSTELLDVRTIALSRSAHAIAYSHIRKGRSAARAAWRTAVAGMRLESAISGRDRIDVGYEELVARPAETLARVMAGLGLSYEHTQLYWTSQTHHMLCGNHMRFASDPDIRADDDWRTELSPVQRGMVSALTGPMRTLGRLGG